MSKLSFTTEQVDNILKQYLNVSLLNLGSTGTPTIFTDLSEALNNVSETLRVQNQVIIFYSNSLEGFIKIYLYKSLSLSNDSYLNVDNWVDLSDAPADNRSYGRRNNLWSVITGGGGGTSDHRDLTNRDASDQHPVEAITNLSNRLEGLGTNIDEISSGLEDKASLDYVGNAITEHNNNKNAHGNLIEQVSIIETKIPSSASASNLLTDRDFVNSSIQNMAANYVTSNVEGNSFSSFNSLVTGPYYYGGSEYNPSNNDYALVLSDENHSGATTRYVFIVNRWSFQYIVNNTPFTQDQINAINSGVTSDLINNYSQHLLNTENPHDVTKIQLGLGNVDNTSDSNKPLSTLQKTYIDNLMGDLGAILDRINRKIV